MNGQRIFPQLPLHHRVTIRRARKLESLHSLSHSIPLTARLLQLLNEWRSLCAVVYIVVKVSAFGIHPHLVNKPHRASSLFLSFSNQCIQICCVKDNPYSFILIRPGQVA